MQTHALLYEINTPIILEEIGRALGRPATLDDLPDAIFDQAATRGFRLVWLLGVWQTGPAGRQVSLGDPDIMRGARAELPDLTEEDVTGSPFAIRAYRVRPEWGGPAALARVRRRLAERGLGLIVDFVPNHVALDHAWVEEHPEYLIRGTEEDLAREPQNYVQLPSRGGRAIFAYGRDPHFAGWPDTVQLNYRHAGLRQAMIARLEYIAEVCDGVRCDMAMLILPDVFERTWGARSQPSDGTAPVSEPFWPQAIARTHGRNRSFLFIAEAYWGREWDLQQQGFDFTYDKRLYDRLVAGAGQSVREHLLADPIYQAKSVRFLENHDEPRAAAVFPLEVYRAAATIAFLVPGMRLFHEGQFEGRRSPLALHAGRRRHEERDPAVQQFYQRLLPCLARPEVHDGDWHLWECRPAWDGNESWQNIVVFTWSLGERRLIVAVNYAPIPGQCYITIGLSELAGRTFELVDLLGDARYRRDGDGLIGNGLYLDMPAWGHQVLDVRPLE